MTILELGPGMCRWPVGRDASGVHQFCGARVAGEGTSYCGQHRKDAFVAVKPISKKVAANLAALNRHTWAKAA